MTQQVFDMEKFQEQGYLVARDVLDPEVDLAPVFTEYEELLDRLSRMWLKRGTISDTFEGMPFNERLVQIAIATRGNYYPYVDISFTQTDVEERMPVHSGPAVFNLLRSPRMLDAVEQFIGPEIYCNPVQHVRIKPPETALPEDMLSDSSVGYTAWHQDQGVIIPDADESDILTVWLPVIEATEENGCMVVVPGSHRAGLVPHCPPKPEREARAHPGRASRRGRYTRALEARRRSVHAQADHALLPAQPQQRHTLELRPPLQPHRPGHGSALVPRFRRPQQGRPRVRSLRPRRVGNSLGTCRRGPGQEPDPRLQPLESRRPPLRVAVF